MNKKELSVFVVGLILLTLCLFVLCTSVNKLGKTIREKGLESIVTEIWEGKK